MGSAVHDYTYTVQVKSRFDLFAKDDFNVEDSSMAVKSRAEKRERRTSGKAKSEASEKVNAKEAGPQKDRRGDAKKSEQKPNDASKKDHSQRGKVFDFLFAPSSGVKAVMKKDGYGTGNWGTIEDELEAQTEEVNIDQPAEEKESAVQSAPQEPAEEQPKTYTLKEYREMKKKANVTLATNKTRRPNDGKNVFSDMVVLHDSQPVETKVEVILEDPKQAEEETKKPTFFEFGRGGAGNSGRPFQRGGPRGGGGRGGPRSDQPRDRKPVEPQEQAPAEEQKAISEEAGGEKEVHQPTTDRRGRGRGAEGGRPFRGRGRGGRGGFSSDRGGRGRGGATPAGDRPAPRGGNRGGPRGAGRPRGGFSASERGGRPEGGRGGFRRGGRGGGFEHPPEGGFRGDSHQQQQQRAAPRMDSDADFPALK
ncbi:hypothetical protein ACTXT7_011327 [Hymenolepis weldensis]